MRLTIYLRRGLAVVEPQEELQTYDQVDHCESSNDFCVMHGFLVVLPASSGLQSLWRKSFELRVSEVQVGEL